MTRPTVGSGTEKRVLGTPNVQAIGRTLDVLEAMQESGASQTLGELAKQVNLHKATVHRILTTLERRGYFEQDPISRRFRLGVRLLQMGAAYHYQNDLVRLGQPILDQLTARTEHTSYLGVLDHRRYIVVAVAWLGRGIKFVTRVGEQLPPHATAGGKALLACMSDRDLETFFAGYEFTSLTRHTKTSPHEIRAELAQIRERGYAMNREESSIGLAGAAAPIADHSGRVNAALALLWPIDSVPKENEAVLVQAVLEAASRLGRTLDHGDAMQRRWSPANAMLPHDKLEPELIKSDGKRED